MLKQIAAGVLALGALNSHAAEQAYHFTFTGAQILYGAWDPNASTSGTFVVDDLNADGVFTLPEVKSFIYDAQTEQNCGESQWVTCQLSAFNWDPNGKFTVNYYWRERSSNGGTPPFDGGSISDSLQVTNGYSYWGHFFDFGEGSYQVWEITPQTRLTITPVPEPHTYLMLGAGLLAVGALRRRSRARAA